MSDVVKYQESALEEGTIKLSPEFLNIIEHIRNKTLTYLNGENMFDDEPEEDGEYITELMDTVEATIEILNRLYEKSEDIREQFTMMQHLDFETAEMNGVLYLLSKLQHDNEKFIENGAFERELENIAFQQVSLTDPNDMDDDLKFKLIAISAMNLNKEYNIARSQEQE